MRSFFTLALVGAASVLAACGSDDSSSTADTVKYLPCDVDAALTVCRGCHTTPLNKGAPFPLRTYADTQGTFQNEIIWKEMKAAIENGIMPQEGKLTDAEKKTLADWFAKGAPGETTRPTCP